MMDILRRHPFPVVAHFERVVAVSFAFPAPVLERLVPAGLALDRCGDFGFVTVALVWTKALRPAGWPRAFGRDFFLAGYRVFCRLREPSGRRLRGLKILRSETDRRSMVWPGNLLTRYDYRRVKVSIERTGAMTRVATSRPGGEPTLDLTFDDSPGAGLPPGSPFRDWPEARRFAGPMPFTFSPEGEGKFVVIDGSRSEWKPRPVAVGAWCVGLFDEPPLRGETPVLANAFVVENVDYRWERGRIVQAGEDA